MTRKRKIQDALANFTTYLSTFISVIMLVVIFIYVFAQGLPGFSLKLLSEPYWTENQLVVPKVSKGELFSEPKLSEGQYFSAKYGVVLEDKTDHDRIAQVAIVYISPDSPLAGGYNLISGSTQGEYQAITLGSYITKLQYTDLDGNFSLGGKIAGMNAQTTATVLDTQVATIQQIQLQTRGGGVYGSLIATLMVIGITLLIALPIGIFAAIYLHELAPHNRRTGLLRSAIEMLSGVPSIIFGLMGVAVLFPITALFNVKSTSVILGSMTMAIMLLPVIIRSTEEALIVVPEGYRDGSLSLGATQTQTIFNIIIPAALPGIMSSVLLSISRIIGESAALIFTMGTYISDSPRLTQGATTLAVQIWSIMSGDNPNFQLACAISMIILVLVLILNLSVKLLSRQLTKKWSV